MAWNWTANVPEERESTKRWLILFFYFFFGLESDECAVADVPGPERRVEEADRAHAEDGPQKGPANGASRHGHLGRLVWWAQVFGFFSFSFPFFALPFHSIPSFLPSLFPFVHQLAPSSVEVFF